MLGMKISFLRTRSRRRARGGWVSPGPPALQPRAAAWTFRNQEARFLTVLRLERPQSRRWRPRRSAESSVPGSQTAAFGCALTASPPPRARGQRWPPTQGCRCYPIRAPPRDLAFPNHLRMQPHQGIWGARFGPQPGPPEFGCSGRVSLAPGNGLTSRALCT